MVSEEEEEAEDLEVDEVEAVSVGVVEVDSEVVAAVVVVVAGVVDSEAAEGSVEVTKATLTLCCVMQQTQHLFYMRMKIAHFY